MKLMNGCGQEMMESKTNPDLVPDGSCPTPPPPLHASNNVLLPGTEAVEFTLAIKPKGTPVFRLSALYKSRLRACIFLHFLLFLFMCAKLSEDILDRMDIFILELEELYIPKPLFWEWLWTSSILFAIIGLNATAHNRLSSMNSYSAGTIVFGILPLFGAAAYFFNDIWAYAEMKNEADVEKWQDYPVAVWWYGFILVAFQVHLFSLYFAVKLIKLWKAKIKKC